MSKKKTKQERTEQILNAAMDIAIRDGYHALKRDDIAEEANVATGLVHYIFGTMGQLRRAVIRRTVTILDSAETLDESLLNILAQGLASGENEAKKAPDNLKNAALKLLF